MDKPFAPVVAAWLAKIKLATDFKNRRFGIEAEEGMQFYTGPYDFLYKEESGTDGRRFKSSSNDPEIGDIPPPAFQMTCNMVAEMVQIFGPVLYHRNPVRQVNPRTYPEIPPALVNAVQQDPASAMMVQQMGQQQMMDASIDQTRASLLQHYLNYTPTALDLKTESRRAIDEALIKGMGCLSGGTLVYAKIDERHTVIRIRDLMRVEGVIHLWDGSQWNRVVGIKKKPKEGGELKLTLRSGEEVNCTANHGWPTQRGLLRADELVVGDKLNYSPIEPPAADSPEHLADEIGWFIGLYLGDGHIPAAKSDFAIGIAGHVDEQDRHDRLARLVRSYGGKIRWTTVEGTRKKDAMIYSRVLVAIVREYVTNGRADTKHLKTSCFERSNAFLSNLLDGYLDSDGHFVEKENIWRLHFCDNKELAASLRVVAARLGHRMMLRRRKSPIEGRPDRHVFQGSIRLGASKNSLWVDPGEIVEIAPADWRCDYFYDISVECDPHTYCLASGLVTHNCLWTEVYTPPGSGSKMVGSFFDSVDNLFIDPDCKILREAKWIAKKCCRPVWEVERMYQLQPGTLKSNANSTNAVGEAMAAKGDGVNQAGTTADLITYYEVYSKCGAGGRLSGSGADGVPVELRAFLDAFGDNVYLVIAEGNDLPLNISPQVMATPDAFGQASQLVAQALSWPTPFWADGAWPFVPIYFHDIPEDPWPMSHLAPGIGELKFLNWMFSYLAGKVRITCRDFIAVDQSAAEDLVNTILHGTDLSLIKIKKSAGKSIDQIVQFLQHPNFNGDLYKVADLIMDLFRHRVGLTELMYGTSSASFRSAAEAQAKRDQMNVRPDDMANKVEDAMSQVARQEALAARWHLQPQDVAPVMGTVGTMLWGQYVVPSNPAEILFQLEYRIEAGSARKPNKDRDAANLQQAVQTFLPFYQQVAMTGLQLGVPQFVQPFNTLVAMWAKTNDFQGEGLLLPVPQPGMPIMPPPQPQENSSGNGPPK